MIKICHIVNHITGKSDGVYTHLKMIFNLTDKNKFQHFLVFQGGEKIEKEVAEMGIKVFVCESLNKKISIKAFSDIYKFIKENEIDIIHTHLVKPYAIGGLLNIFLRKKFIFNYNGLFIYKNDYYNLLEKLLYGTVHLIINSFKPADIVLIPSKKSKELILQETSLFPDPVVYYNGYNLKSEKLSEDNELTSKINEEKKTGLIIAVVARLERQKRIDFALELIAAMIEKKYSVKLLIFGDGLLKNELIQKAESLNIEKSVVFFDYVQNVDLYFKYFDVLLYTSGWEGMPLSMWEAMANKVPVLAPDVGGFREILEEDKCGVIFNPENFNDAQNKLQKLIEDKSLRIKLGENGFKAIEEKYSTETFIKQIENIYLNLLK